MRKQSVIDHLYHEPSEWKKIGREGTKGLSLHSSKIVLPNCKISLAKIHATEFLSHIIRINILYAFFCNYYTHIVL